MAAHSLLLRLGVNIDHVATVRNARGGDHPDPVLAAHIAVQEGADSITAHLREDRRHIRDDDVTRLKKTLTVPLNLEMAATEEMTHIALSTLPHAVCLVPEKREERTTEGGLDLRGGGDALATCIKTLGQAGIRVSLFIEPDRAALDYAVHLGAPVVELHTGTYCDAAERGDEEKTAHELMKIRASALYATSLGLEVHAGHGLSLKTVAPIAAITEIRELNIGHFLIGSALFEGLPAAVRAMRAAMNAAR